MRTDFDKRVAQSVSMRFSNSDLIAFEEDSVKDDIILFQFPPKILSDNRGVNWSEGHLIGREPVAVIATSSPREISLSWTYMVEDYTVEGIDKGPIRSETWSIAKIKQQVNTLRGYASRASLQGGFVDNMIVFFRYPWLTGSSSWSCRLTNVNVKHGETLVGTPNNIFPLRSDISVDLRLWTTGAVKRDDPTAVQRTAALSPEPSPTSMWY